MYTTNNWNAMVYEGVASTHKVKPLPVTEDTATVVEVVRRARDSYGEGYEGEGSGYLIFQVGNRYFKKTFYESSYSDEITFWDNDVEEVFGQVKTVMTFIPKED